MRISLVVSALLLVALSACSPAPKQTGAAAAITVSEAWAAATPGGAKVAAGYMTLNNSSAEDDQLVAVASPRAAHVEIHTMEMQGDMMTMRALDSGLLMPAGRAAVLKPGSAHLMFIEINAPFVAGENVPVTLTFQKAGKVEAVLPVKPMGGGDMH